MYSINTTLNDFEIIFSIISRKVRCLHISNVNQAMGKKTNWITIVCIFFFVVFICYFNDLIKDEYNEIDKAKINIQKRRKNE